MILDDSEVAGGDILTDDAPFTFEILNAGFERVQAELSAVGVEDYQDVAWIIGIPALTILDPEARILIGDQETVLAYPNGVNDANFATPTLPSNLNRPLECWERQSGPTDYTGPRMRQARGNGLLNMIQQQFLIDWDWRNNQIVLRGATQIQDLKVRYDQQLARIAAPTDPVPIRGVVNAAAYNAACFFCESRGGAVSPLFRADGDREIDLLRKMSSRRRQRIPTRRRPYSGRRGGRGWSAF